MSWWLRLLAVLLLVGIPAAGGYYLGAEHVRSQWQAARLEEAKQTEAQAETWRIRARANAANYETERQRLRASLVIHRRALRDALQVPIACPPDPGASHATLADLRVPTAAVDRLRSAGAKNPGPR